MPVWVARAISRETHDLSPDAVAFADRLICATPDKVRQVDADQLVEEARLYFDPDRAVADEEHELTRAGSGSGTAQPRHHRHLHDPRHPRRPAFNETVTKLANDLADPGTPTRSMSVGPMPSGSWPTPSTR